ncbi:hypothetical protein GF376_00165 [Candidatus Peregrinibacteria bacterium]|nr:hypothetical protein [Candidatus Peregrinibacteria bacterium]
MLNYLFPLKTVVNKNNKEIIIVAHRGGSKGIHRENTHDAFKHAIGSGFKCIEMDIRLNHLAGEFFLEHDFLHTPKSKKNYFKKVMNLFEDNSIIPFCELKTVTLTRTFYAESFLKLIRNHNLEDRSIVMSFNPFVLAQLRRIGYRGKIGQLVGSRFVFNSFRGYIKNTIKPDYMMISRKIFSERMVRFAKNIDSKVFIHVANKPKIWKQAIEYDIDGIITDYPDKLKKFINEN